MSGNIKVDSRLVPHASNLTDTIFHYVHNATDGEAIDRRTFVRIESASNATHPYAVYEIAHWAGWGDHIFFQPRHNGVWQPATYTEEELDAEEE